MTAESPKYSRQEISDEAKRKSTAEEIRAANKGVDKKKTPEGKKELSQAWVQKANLTPAQKQSLCDELLVKDIDSEDPKELERRVIALQKHLGFPAKDCDGILGWKTLEKVDQMVEGQHRTEDEESGTKDNENGYGFDRLANEENKAEERATRTEKLRTALATGQTEGLTDADGKGLMIDGVGPDGKKILKGTNENSDKYYNIDTGTYETEKERANRIASEKLSDPNSLESIKDELYRAEGFEDGQKYVESITTYLDDSDLADINKTLEGKKWAINVTNDQGDYREYSLVETETGNNAEKYIDSLLAAQDIQEAQKIIREMSSMDSNVALSQTQIEEINKNIEERGWRLSGRMGRNTSDPADSHYSYVLESMNEIRDSSDALYRKIMNKYANLVNNGDRGTYEGTISQVLPKEVSVSPDGKYLERTLGDEKQWWNTTNGGFWEDSHIGDYDGTGKAGGSKWIADGYHNTPFYELSQEGRQAIQDGKDYNELPMKDLITLSKGALKDNFKPNDVLIKQAQGILEAYADNKIIQKMSLNDFYKLRKDDVAMAKMFADVSGNTMLIPRGFGEQGATYSKNGEVVTKKSPDGTFFIASATKEGSQFEPADKYVLGLKEGKVTLPTGETLEVVKNGTKKSVVLYPEKSTEPTLVFTDGKSEKLPNPV